MGAWLTGNALVALGAAAFWGIGDFSGGMGVKHAGGTPGAAVRVILLSHSLSLTVLLLVAGLRGDPFPHGLPLICGLCAGVSAALSLGAFYIALSRGAMGTAAAISGLLAAAIPALFSISSEGPPGLRKQAGFVVAGIAIWLIAGTSGDHRRSTLWLASAAGAGFGIYFVLLKYAGSAGLVWPMATARIGSVATCTVLLLASRGAQGVQISRKVFGWVLGTALFDTSGNLLFVAATRAGRLDVAAVLASLYPASTILMAAWLLREQPTPRQGLGMAIAAAAVVLIAA